ncbi:hypothetical protein KW805_00245 [Candidatus Pacearchaeota archaeon]|nr:hypothetical protein [Candidatus Pacearchaeota archaeon]
MTALMSRPSEEVSTDNLDSSALLDLVRKRESGLRSKLQSQKDELDKGQEDTFKFLQYSYNLIAKIDSTPFISYDKKVAENPYHWFLTFPPQFKEGEMSYSEGQFKQFSAAVEKGNETMDTLIKIYNESEKRVILKALLPNGQGYHSSIGNRDKGFETGGNPVKVWWRTFALPNLLDKPLLAKALEFDHAVDSEHRGHLQGKKYGFRIVNTSENELKPLFLWRQYYAGSHCPTFEKMDHLLLEQMGVDPKSQDRLKYNLWADRHDTRDV